MEEILRLADALLRQDGNPIDWHHGLSRISRVAEIG